MLRKKVRKRVEVWGQLPKHADMGHFGDPAHYEWKQFFIGYDIEPRKAFTRTINEIELPHSECIFKNIYGFSLQIFDRLNQLPTSLFIIVRGISCFQIDFRIASLF